MQQPQQQTAQQDQGQVQQVPAYHASFLSSMPHWQEVVVSVYENTYGVLEAMGVFNDALQLMPYDIPSLVMSSGAWQHVYLLHEAIVFAEPAVSSDSMASIKALGRLQHWLRLLRIVGQCGNLIRPSGMSQRPAAAQNSSAAAATSAASSEAAVLRQQQLRQQQPRQQQLLLLSCLQGVQPQSSVAHQLLLPVLQQLSAKVLYTLRLAGASRPSQKQEQDKAAGCSSAREQHTALPGQLQQARAPLGKLLPPPPLQQQQQQQEEGILPQQDAGVPNPAPVASTTAAQDVTAAACGVAAEWAKLVEWVVRGGTQPTHCAFTPSTRVHVDCCPTTVVSGPKPQLQDVVTYCIM
jgi:hypothetical protein